jgi:hypothetical protein
VRADGHPHSLLIEQHFMKTNSLRKLDSSRVQLFLRVKHPSIDPREISNTIGIEPEHAVQAGQSISAKGKPTLHSESYWIAQLLTPELPSIEAMKDWRALLSTSSVVEKTAIQKRYFASNRNSFLNGLSKDDVIELIGASPIEVMILPWIKKLAAHREFLTSINDDSGSVTLVVQLREVEHPMRIRPSLARRLADTGIELEIDWSA